MSSAVITGGTGGLGKEIARHLIDHEWEVSAPGSRELDVRSSASITDFFQNREIDLLVCCAGVIRDRPLLKLDESDWDELIGINYEGSRLCAEAVIPKMAEKRSGHIIFISSHSAFHPPVGQTAYAVSKAALTGLTVSLARKYGSSGIRINAICPGFLETPMTQSVSAARRAEVLESHVLGRFNTLETVAAFIRFVHEGLPHTSGQVFALDNRPMFPLGDI